MSIIVSQIGNTSVVDIVTLALKDAGIVGEGQTASADTMNDAFTTLVQMLSLWQVDSMAVYAQADTSFVPTGAQSYAVGIGGDFNIARPAKIDYAYWRSGTLDFPVDVINTFEEYERIVQKTIGTTPVIACYRPDYPSGTLYVWPQPTGGTLHIVTTVQLQNYATIADNLSLPAEYQLPVRYSLAVLLSAAFGTPLRPDVAALAAAGRKIIKRNNVRIPPAQMPIGIPMHGHSYIERGY